MFIDALTLVSSAQQVTADAVTTDKIDLGNVTPKRQIGTGEPMGFGIAVTAAGTNTGSAVIQAIQSAGDDLGSPDVMASIAVATSGLALGQFHIIPLPPGMPTKRYIGLNYDITGTVDFTVRSWLAPLSMLSRKALDYGHKQPIQ